MGRPEVAEAAAAERATLGRQVGEEASAAEATAGAEAAEKEVAEGIWGLEAGGAGTVTAAAATGSAAMEATAAG